ncbi:MAG: c-type cytochrome [Solirubrobacteraceae bacterium]|jgi:quinoprotein glucose dehydrogenase
MNERWRGGVSLTALMMICASGSLHAQDAAFNAGVFPTRSVWSGVYTQAQAARGKAAYQQICSECHGPELEGDGANAVSQLAGPGFMSNWDNRTVGELVRRIHAQPNDSPEDIGVARATDLVAFILASNGIPAGNEELPTERAIQAQILITSQKPR